MKTFYYSHRYRDPDPAKQAENLARAKERFAEMRRELSRYDIKLIAPWIGMADAGIAEEFAWPVLVGQVATSDATLVDLDGDDALSGGMRAETTVAAVIGRSVLYYVQDQEGTAPDGEKGGQ
jgi:hypothetical protein